MNRIERKFSELRRQNKKAFIAFLTAGYPNLNTTKRLVLEFAKIGVDIIELGIPFSDPLADGPIIQEASQSALKRKINIDDILRLVKALRTAVEIPICLMSYYNPIFCYGQQSFIKKASTFGVDGVIIPDLPPEEAHSFIGLANKFNLDTIFFLSPTSPLERIRLVSRISKGFIYYVSLMGVTGLRQRLATDLVSNINLIKRNTRKPVCVGFGVSHPEHVKKIFKIADGVIVGSAIIKKIKDNIGKPDLVKRVSRFVYSLKR
jgi:tryptophan synthase alpha chain